MLVAAILCEEDGDSVVGEELGPVLVLGLLVRGMAAPRVDVVSPEIDTGGRVAASEVGGQIVPRVHVRGRVANTYRLTIALAFDVSFGVSNCSFDESGGGCLIVVNDDWRY